jgi:hypothetical protein
MKPETQGGLSARELGEMEGLEAELCAKRGRSDGHRKTARRSR